jgi:hypothetical protein
MALDQECCDADCHLSWMSFMMSVASKPIMLSVIMLNVVVPSIVALSQSHQCRIQLMIGPIKLDSLILARLFSLL